MFALLSHWKTASLKKLQGCGWVRMNSIIWTGLTPLGLWLKCERKYRILHGSWGPLSDYVWENKIYLKNSLVKRLHSSLFLDFLSITLSSGQTGNNIYIFLLVNIKVSPSRVTLPVVLSDKPQNDGLGLEDQAPPLPQVVVVFLMFH